VNASALSLKSFAGPPPSEWVPLAQTLVYLRSLTLVIADDSLNDRLPRYRQIKIRKGG
jgi:hypothetical protein